jgi:thiamine biosynthesis protein ThiS
LQLAEGATLADLLNELDIERRVVISVNNVQESDRSLQLKDGDEVKIFSSVSGG